MAHKQLTSWERRRRRTVRITVLTVCFFVIAIAGLIAYLLFTPYETLELNKFYTVKYDGYDSNGTAEIVPDKERLDAAIDAVKTDYREAFIHLHSCTDADYDDFAASFTAALSRTDQLSNGDTIGVSYACDMALAKKLNVRIENANETVTVEGLPVVTILTKEDLFRDLSVNCSGISPDVTVSIVNNSPDPFIRSIVYQPLTPKERYANGDVVSVRAFFNAEDALAQLYAVNCPTEECVNDYTVSVEQSYVTDAYQLGPVFVEEAASAGMNAFTNANEYGVRIFCEANLVPVYVNKQATFEWGEARFRSAYLKCTREEYLGKSENHYNDLDIVYETSIKQANGVSCPCYAVVRFSDLMIEPDGSVSADLTHPKVMSADYKADNVHKTVVTTYEGTHIVTKVGAR